MIYNLIDSTAEESLNGTSILNTFALQNGADILRVHDVKEAVETIKNYRKIKRVQLIANTLFSFIILDLSF